MFLDTMDLRAKNKNSSLEIIWAQLCGKVA